MSLVILSVTARFLGAEGRGSYVAVTSWALIAGSFASLSLGQVVLHQRAARAEEESLGDVVGSALALMALGSLVVWGLAFLGYRASGGELFRNVPVSALALAFTALPGVAGADLGRFALLSQGRVGAYTLVQVTAYTISAVALIAASAASLELAGALAAWILLYLTLACASLGAALRSARARLRVRAACVGRLLRGGVSLHLTTVATFLQLHGSVLILNHHRGPEETAWYQLGMQLVGAATILPLGIGAVTYGMVAREGPDVGWGRQRRLVAAGVAAAVAVVGVGYALAPTLIEILAGESFLPALPAFRASLFALFGMTLAIVMASQWIGRGLFWQTSCISVAAASIGLALGFLLIPRMGLRGAVWSTLVVYTFSLLVNGSMALYAERRWRARVGR
jgi:O-antigen/teichoic acid export membrane protein